MSVHTSIVICNYFVNWEFNDWTVKHDSVFSAEKLQCAPCTLCRCFHYIRIVAYNAIVVAIVYFCHLSHRENLRTEQKRVRVFCCGWNVTLGGNVTLADLEGYVSSFKDPVNVTLSNGDYTIYNPPPPSSGVVLDFILGVLDGRWFRIYTFSGLPLPRQRLLVAQQNR